MRNSIYSVFLLILVLFGYGCCSSSYNHDYIEGTSLTIGLWIPINGNLYGFQAFNYLNGKRYRTLETNAVFSTSLSLTNTAFSCNSSHTSSTYINENIKTEENKLEAIP